jgi:endogenous inhibitor of DNA gyrase (YacG/DUF329 family)
MIKYELAIRCPETGLPVQTGEKTAERVLLQSVARRTLARCPACEGSHVWQIREASLIHVTDSVADQGDAELL